MYQQLGKKLFDFGAALFLTFTLSPIFLLVMVAVWLAFGSSVFFRQERPGKNGRLFTIFKFRTMTDARDAEGKLLPDAQRVTRFGKFLRATSLDELPELFNILRGEMSLVGPRPLLPEYLDLYTPEQQRRHLVKPGLTGWAQINGRNAISWEKRFNLDVWYVQNLSWQLDVKILFLTVWRVLRREGISQPGQATMQPFQGTPEMPILAVFQTEKDGISS
ncbi:MAG: sugar transferase [Chloroflexota bacterium]